MASIDEVRAGIALAVDKAGDAQGAIQQAQSEMEQAQQALQRATEGSQQSDADEANNLFQAVISALAELTQSTAAGIQSAEGVANRL